MTATTPHTDEARTLEILSEAAQKLATGNCDVMLDFSAVQRLDVELLRRLEELAGIADQKAARITLQNVNIDVYKVLKLMKLTRRLSFVN